MRHTAPRIVSEVAMLARLTRDLPGFLRRPVTAEQAASSVKRRVETRSVRFLETVARTIYGHAPSPYLRLLRAAGCELGDLQDLMRREGVEGALAHIADEGVYVGFDEFKGRREIVRGSERFAAAESDFDNPRYSPHVELRTGASRGPGTAVKVGLPTLADQAECTAVALDAHGLAQSDQVVWMTSPFREVLRYAKLGRPPLAWFYPLKPFPWKARLAGRYLQLLGRALGCRFPGPRWNDIKRPDRMADWLGRRVAEGGPICVTTYASSAVRVARAARASGLRLDGACFITKGEPFTETKLRAFEDVGARGLVGYGMVEASILGYGCAEPSGPDDVHFFSDSYALIQRPRAVGDFGVSVNAYLFTTLQRHAPKILLNVENGDHGVLEQRACGCPMGTLGLREHISEIRSYEKLTGEGMTFVKTELLPLIEQVLPARFGGSSDDYQVLEEEGVDGIPRLFLLVSPRVGAVHDDQVRHAFIEALGHDGELGNYMVRMWTKAETVQILREAPRATRAGKILPLHLVNSEN